MIHRRLGAFSIVGCPVALASLLASLSSCSAPPSVTDGHEPTGALRGELEIISLLRTPGPEGRQHYLRVDGSEDRVRLKFDGDPDLVPWAHVRVWGKKDADVLHVAGFEEVDDPSWIGSQAQALVGQPSTSRSIAIAMVNINGGGTNPTMADMNRIFVSRANKGPLFDDMAPGLSVFQYYDQTTYGMLRPTGQIFGPYNFNGDACGDIGGALSNAIKPMIPGKFDHYVYFYGSEQASCPAGWADQGTYSKPGNSVWLNNITFASGPAEEISHNLGYLHSQNIVSCPSGLTVPMPDDLASCTLDEYGNLLSVMGQGTSDAPAFEKWYAHWLSGCNAIRVRQSATFKMVPLETPCNGVQALQIPLAKPRTFTTPQSGGKASNASYFYLEFRTNVGMDSKGKSSYTPITLNPGIFVHISDDIQPQTKTCARGVLLDMNLSTKSNPDGLGAGQSYTEPGNGVSFKVDALDAQSATVTVTIPGGTGMNTCDDGTPFMGPGPGPESCAGVVQVDADGGLLDSGSVAPPPPVDAGRGGAGGSSGRNDGGTTSAGTAGSGGVMTGAGGNTASGTGGTGGGSGGVSTGGDTVGVGGGVGSGGSVGAGGNGPGSAGSVGSGGTSPGSAGSSAGRTPPPPVEGGCACRMREADRGSRSSALLALGVALTVLRSRRRRAA